MGRTATNVVGNSIATAVIARTTQLEELNQETDLDDVKHLVSNPQQNA